MSVTAAIEGGTLIFSSLNAKLVPDAMAFAASLKDNSKVSDVAVPTVNKHVKVVDGKFCND